MRAPLSELKSTLEKHIGKKANGIAEANIQFAVNFMYQSNAAAEELENSEGSSHGLKIFPQARVIDSETGHRVLCEDEDICPESPESSIYLMQNIQVGDSTCPTFFDSGANTHLIVKTGRIAVNFEQIYRFRSYRRRMD